MKSLSLSSVLFSLLGMVSGVCNTASTDSNFVCMISGAGINVHWRTDTAGNYYEMMVDAQTTGYSSVGWNPTNPAGNKMIGSTVLMGGTADLNTVKMYSPTNTNGASIIATEAAIPSTITQTAITSTGGRVAVRFRRTGVSSGNLLTIFASGSTGTLSRHTNRASQTIDLADGIPQTTPVTAPPTPPPTPTPIVTSPPTPPVTLPPTPITSPPTPITSPPTPITSPPTPITPPTPPFTFPPTPPITLPPTPITSPPTPITLPPTAPPATIPPTPSSCTPSTLIHIGITRYDCMQSLTAAVTMHWNRATTGTTAIAATSTNVNGWFAVAFPQNAGVMTPATAVATSSTATAGVYSITSYSAAGITNTAIPTINSVTTELANGLRILRFNAAISLLTGSTPINYASHSASFQFPVNSAKHTTRGGGVVNFLIGGGVVPTPPVSTCAASTLIESGSTRYGCMQVLSPEVAVHWSRGTATGTGTTRASAPLNVPVGMVAVAFTTSSVNGWFSVSFPQNAGVMSPATAVATSSSTIAETYSINSYSASGITRLISANIATSTTEVVNGQRILRFNIQESFLRSNMPVNYAYHSSIMQFPLDSAKHTTRGSSFVNFLVSPIISPPASTCVASTLIRTGTTRYNCMKALTTSVTMHWNRATTGTTAIAATSTNVNGWFAVAFPTNAGAMAPATSVAMSSATTAGIYSITAKSAAGIATTTSTVVDTPTVETANGLRILRYNAAVSILRSNMPVNYAFHSTEIGFPVNIHTTRGGGTVDFVSGVPVPPVVTPPTFPSGTCTPSTLIQTGTTTYDCMLALSAAVTIHWNRETTATNTAMAASAGVGGWLSIGFPTVATSMTPATAVSSSSATAGGVYSITGRSASAITATTSPNMNFMTTEVLNGNRVIRFNVLTSFLRPNMPVNYAVHSTNPQFPVGNAQHTERGSSVVNFASGTSQSVVGDRNDDTVLTHGRAMIFIWQYWVPLAIFIKGVGPLFCKGKVCGFPVPFVLHAVMMFIAMILTTVFAAIALNEFNNDVDYSHREIGIVILSFGWLQILGGIAKPANDSSFRKYWGWGHILFGITIFILAVVQMAFGIKNVDKLYPNTDTNSLKVALVVGLALMGTIVMVGRIYATCKRVRQEQQSSKDPEMETVPPHLSHPQHM